MKVNDRRNTDDECYLNMTGLTEEFDVIRNIQCGVTK